MDNREITDQLQELKKELESMLAVIEDVNKKWQTTLTASHNSQMENTYLRERMQELTFQNEQQAQLLQESNKANQAEKANAGDGLGMSKARQNLMHIYDDGFHICNVSYGQRRENDEQCMFCLDILYADHKV